MSRSTLNQEQKDGREKLSEVSRGVQAALERSHGHGTSRDPKNITCRSIGVHLFNTRNMERKESIIEIITLYVIGLSGWFGIMSGLFGHILYADQVATSIGWPVNSGFQMELGFASISIGLVGLLSFWNKAYWLPFIIMKFMALWEFP